MRRRNSNAQFLGSLKIAQAQRRVRVIEAESCARTVSVGERAGYWFLQESASNPDIGRHPQ